jgi:hypothetical protein
MKTKRYVMVFAAAVMAVSWGVGFASPLNPSHSSSFDLSRALSSPQIQTSTSGASSEASVQAFSTLTVAGTSNQVVGIANRASLASPNDLNANTEQSQQSRESNY